MGRLLDVIVVQTQEQLDMQEYEVERIMEHACDTEVLSRTPIQDPTRLTVAIRDR